MLKQLIQSSHHHPSFYTFGSFRLTRDLQFCVQTQVAGGPSADESPRSCVHRCPTFCISCGGPDLPCGPFWLHSHGRPSAPPLQHRRIDIGVNVRAANVKIGLKLLFSRLTAPSQPPTLAQKLVANEPMLTLQLHRLVFKAVFNNSVSFCFCLVSPPKGPARLLQSTFNSPLKEKKLINLHLLTTSGANPVQITQLATNN